jgi:hypothetical protein
MKLRKIVATIMIAALFFWAPSAIPVKASGIGIGCGGFSWLTADTAFAGAVPIPLPCPTPTAPTPWVPIVIGAGVVSIMLNALIVSQTQCRELTSQEAWSSFLLPFIAIALNQKNNKCHH